MHSNGIEEDNVDDHDGDDGYFESSSAEPLLMFLKSGSTQRTANNCLPLQSEFLFHIGPPYVWFRVIFSLSGLQGLR